MMDSAASNSLFGGWFWPAAVCLSVVAFTMPALAVRRIKRSGEATPLSPAPTRGRAYCAVSVVFPYFMVFSLPLGSVTVYPTGFCLRLCGARCWFKYSNVSIVIDHHVLRATVFARSSRFTLRFTRIPSNLAVWAALREHSTPTES